MKNSRKLYLGILWMAVIVLSVMVVSTIASTTESGGADIRAPMLALIAGALMCLRFAPLQPEILRATEQALAAMVATGSGWFWLAEATGDHWSTLKGLGLFVALATALAATIVILLLGAIIPTVTAIRNCIKSRHH